MPHQLSFFPDAFEVQERALRALEGLDLEEAARRVEEARRRDPGLVELDPLQAAIAWLREELGSGDASDERLAAAFARVPAAVAAGRLELSAAARVDEVLARCGLARASGESAFLDAKARVPRGALHLVLGRAAEALPLLRAALAGEHDGRAELWGYVGDACLLAARPDEANAAYVRALVLDAGRLDLHRLRDARLRALSADLARAHPEPEARERLLAAAWLAGVLSIPRENGWLDRHLSRLRAATAVRAESSPAERQRRFAFLLYLDRCRPRGEWDEGEREEMHALDPELFALVLERFGALERRETAPLAW